MRLLFSSLVFSALVSALAAADFDASRSRALLIGISDYDSGDLSSLHFAASDAERLGTWLIGNGWQRDHLRILRNEAADKATIRDQLERLVADSRNHLARTGRPLQTVFIGYAGHGLATIGTNGPIMEESNRPAMVPTDARLGKLSWTYGAAGWRNHSLVSWDAFATLLLRIEAEQVVVVLDACESAVQLQEVAAEAWQGIQSGPPTVASARPGERPVRVLLKQPAPLTTGPRRQLIVVSAAPRGETTREEAALGGGILTWALTTALTQGNGTPTALAAAAAERTQLLHHHRPLLATWSNDPNARPLPIIGPAADNRIASTTTTGQPTPDTSTAPPVESYVVVDGQLWALNVPQGSRGTHPARHHELLRCQPTHSNRHPVATAMTPRYKWRITCR